MGLLSFFKHAVYRSGAAPRAGWTDEAIAAARVKARQRLVGAFVLVVTGVITLPMLFDREPRPLPATAAIDMPMSPPSKVEASAPEGANGVAASVPTSAGHKSQLPQEFEEVVADVAAAPAAPSAAMRSSSASGQPPLGGANAVTVESAKSQQQEAALRDKERERSEKKRLERERAEHERQRQQEAKEKQAKATALSEAQRAKELADQSPNKEGKDRFVVQIGAFSDQGAANQARARVDKLGVKTYTQMTESPAGPRVRVRVGPFQDRAEAEKILAKLKASGVSGVVLTL